MQFFLHEMLARIVAIYLCVDCCRYLWHGLVERKIAYFIPSFLDWLIDGSNGVAHRDATPVRYWIQIGIQISLLVAASLLRYSAGCSQTPEPPLTALLRPRVMFAFPRCWASS